VDQINTTLRRIINAYRTGRSKAAERQSFIGILDARELEALKVEAILVQTTPRGAGG
jgi:hypothetical protein